MARTDDLGHSSAMADTDVQVIEQDGHLFKPKPGSSVTAEQFLAARALAKEINDEARWNTWVRDERQVEFDQAVEVIHSWTRAEPGFRPWTTEETNEWFARMDRDFAEKHAADEPGGRRTSPDTTETW